MQLRAAGLPKDRCPQQHTYQTWGETGKSGLSILIRDPQKMPNWYQIGGLLWLPAEADANLL